MGALVSKIAFQPPSPRDEFSARLNRALQRLPGYWEERTASGITIPLVCCMPSTAVRPGSPCILFSHGNAEDLGESLPFLASCAEQLQLPVIGFDYPGYGLASTCEPSERGCFEAAQTAYAAVRRRWPEYAAPSSRHA